MSRSVRTGQLVTLVGLALVLGLVSAPVAQGAAVFQIAEAGTGNTSVNVGPGATVDIEIVAMSLTAGEYVAAELDAFTYQINFPNEAFTLQGNTFIGSFDNTQSPAGNNGSLPWWTGTDIAITNGADVGSPYFTPSVADLYRTTATTNPVLALTGPGTLETLSVVAPMALGTYSITLNFLEAVDTMGESHTTTVGGPFDVNVVPIPPAFGLLAMGLGMVGFLRHYLSM